MIDVEISNVVYEYEDGTTLYEIAKDFGDYYENDIILAVCNGKLCELSKVLIDNSKVSFITTANHIGMECYRRSMVFMMIKAFYKIADHSAFDDISPFLHLVCSSRNTSASSFAPASRIAG